MAESGSGTGCTSYYVFTPCCGGIPIRFCRNTPPALVSGATFQYTGPNLIGYGGVLETDKCYGVSVVNESASYPSIAAELIENNFLRATGGCNSALCPECPKKVLIYPCCGGETLEFAYNPDYTTNSLKANQYTGSNIIFDNNNLALIPNACFRIEIVNTTEEEASALPAGPNSSDITFVGKTCGTIEVGVTCASCQYYYQITNCADENETYCTTSNLSAYINNNIENPNNWPTIQVLEKPNKCFYVEQIISCVAPIPITPNPAIPAVQGCTKCQAKIVVYYELINCNDPQVIIYTSSELGDYVGSYIKLDEYSDECFYVSVVDGLVPSDIPVIPKEPAFETCQECTLPRYLLTDCLGIQEDIVTNSDLSAYVGYVIVIESCPDTCWGVEETDITTPDGSVNVIKVDGLCSRCLSDLVPSTCVTFTNTTNIDFTFEVFYSNGEQDKFEVLANSTSPKQCLISWPIIAGIIVTEYGTCIDGVCPPEPAKPKRKVTPGYDTPACTPAYYENVECNFSEWMYKDVLEKRYGISNCCVEELMKWEIKHEMLMLDALVNPDYICQTTSSCCNPTPTTCTPCGCSSCNCNN